MKFRSTSFVCSLLLSAAIVPATLGLANAADTMPAPAPAAARDPFADAMAAGRGEVKAKKWGAAVKSFESAVKLNDNDADAHNMLAFSLRNSGDFERSMKHYDTALKINPKHLGAHEYVGQLFLKLNKLPEAEKHLATLADLCQKKCEEYGDLAAAITAYKKK